MFQSKSLKFKRDLYERRGREDLPGFYSSILRHRASEISVKIFECRYIGERAIEKITTECLVSHVTHVIITHEDTPSKVIDTVNGCNAQALDAA